MLEADHLAVIFTDGEGIETVLSASVYSVDGIGDSAGGSVTYPLLGGPIAAPIPTGTKLTLLRTVPYTQTTVLSNQGGYYPEVVERRFDQIYMALQQLEERLSRASLRLLSDPATEQNNLALIQQLQKPEQSGRRIADGHHGPRQVRAPQFDRRRTAGVAHRRRQRPEFYPGGLG